ncbi:MAG: hypothetical protein FD153_336 [Rhodospirillaceae bacterium]|nr:MAG: hypothetical protein FD153_336 [Rhodospirillaceae bacterium]
MSPGPNLLRVATLAGLEPRSETQTQTLRVALVDALQQSQIVTETLPPVPRLGSEEQASIQIAYANGATLAGTLDQSTDWFQRAISAYRKALGLLNGCSAGPADRGRTQ